jgi:hypothetical protein
MYALLFLAAFVLSAFTRSTQQPGIGAPSGATIAAAEVVRLTSERFNTYPTPVHDDWAASAEVGGTAYPAGGAIEKLDIPPWEREAVSRWSSCWWLWVYSGIQLCS